MSYKDELITLIQDMYKQILADDDTFRYLYDHGYEIEDYDSTLGSEEMAEQFAERMGKLGIEVKIS